MARPLRIEYPGALHHVMSRGNERRAVVRDHADRLRRLDWLRRTVETCGWRLHAFVLMDNHEHLFVETPRPNLSAGMQFLNGSYTSYFNLRHHRHGHLFQGRFKAHLVENAGHYTEISRYIHLNPVRSGMVELPEHYRWSSYAGYHRSAKVLEWVTYARVLREFGNAHTLARRRYRRHMLAGLDRPPASPFDDAVHGLILGSDRFVTKVKRMLDGRAPDKATPVLARLRDRPSLERVVKAAATEFGCDVASWRPGRRVDELGRAAAAWLAKVRFGYTSNEVAQTLGYSSPSSVTKAIVRMELRLSSQARTLRRIEKHLSADR